jgi:hypothetical protein
MSATSTSPRRKTEDTSLWEYEFDEIEEVQELQEPDSSSSPEPFLLETLVGQLLSAYGQHKQRLADELIDRLSCDASAATKAAWVACMILSSSKPGRVDDCLGILSRLNLGVVQEAVNDAISYRPPLPSKMNRWTKDYWYSLVKSLIDHPESSGANRDAVIAIASVYPLDAIREAAVQAMVESPSGLYRERLAIIAKSDQSLGVRRLAAEGIE